ncbi:FUSC family membrane protein [Psychromonas arctica]|uniref:FUSC family membrane protein n=1 Tax=Psychromonas arctica TaxID=168275 RepID=UPI002FD71AB0
MQHSFTLMLRRLITDSNTHSGFRIVIAMACVFIPAIFDLQFGFFKQSSLAISLSLCLGVLASAIVEVDENTKDRQKFIATVIACFFVASSSVELLLPYPILFAVGLGTSTFAFMMLASLGMHYSRIGFGAILIAIYTLIGHQPEAAWFESPMLLALGALWYGLFAIAWSHLSPNRTLREQLAQLFYALSRYQLQKSELFDTQKSNSRQAITDTRQKLAQLNISIVARLASSKDMVKGQYQANRRQQELARLNQYYLVAEQIHERICASQYLYSQLEHTFGRSQILEGFHQLLLQLSSDCHLVGSCIKDKHPYLHSKRLKWTVQALSDQLLLLKQKLQSFDNNQEAMQALQAIYDNLNGIDQLLMSLTNVKSQQYPIIVDNEQTLPRPFWKVLFEAYQQKTPVYKHAVRISVSLVIAFAIQAKFNLNNGYWILPTVLFVCQPSFSETRKRLMLRSFGTLLGILLSFPIFYFLHDTLSQSVLMVLAAFLFITYVKTNYGLAVIFITIMVMILTNLLAPSGIAFLYARIYETLIGCVLSFAAISVIYPDWQFKRFPGLVNNHLLKTSRYFKQVAQQYQFGRSESIIFRQTRFAAFKSDSALTNAWQSMLFEPNSKQHLKKEVYGLVNRCDALCCYIAALSSHRHKIELETELAVLSELFEATSQQILFTYRPELKQSSENQIDIDSFEQYKENMSDEAKLIVEQLRLIAFSAMDIQLLLTKIESVNEKNRRNAQ